MLTTYLVLLRFTGSGEPAVHAAGHRQWIQMGRADGAFLLVAGLSGGAGGAVLAAAADRDEIDARVAADPFVHHGIVDAEVHELAPAFADPRLAFLLPDTR